MGEQGEARNTGQQKTRAYASKGISRRLSDDTSSWQTGDSGAHAYSPTPPTNSIFSSSPMIPAILVMVAFLMLTTSPTTRGWLISATEIPGMAWATITGEPAKLPATEAKTPVWAKKQSGLYYCRGDVLFGRHPGMLIRQEKALTLGYRPANSDFCQDASRKAPAPDQSSVVRFLGID